jgi:exosortase
MNATDPKNRTNMPNSHFHRAIFFAIFCAAGIGVFWEPLRELPFYSFGGQLYTHLCLIPPVSAYFIFLKRKSIFSEAEYALAGGAIVALVGIVLLMAGLHYKADLGQNDYLSLGAAGMVLWVIGGFLGVYGTKAFKKALFPMLFLFFTVPLPTLVLDRSVGFLQHLSTEAVEGVLTFIGTPHVRSGTVFELPGHAMEVAPECSGIRSTLALVILVTVGGYVFLDTGWRRLLLVLAVIPVSVFKNALRISTLGLLASYVDPRWITGSWLHSFGGKPFFIIALIMLAPILWMLVRSERKEKKKNGVKIHYDIGVFGVENRRVEKS